MNERRFTTAGDIIARIVLYTIRAYINYSKPIA